MTNSNSNFHILTVGWGFDLIENLWDRIQTVSGFPFSHILQPSIDQHALAKRANKSNCFCLRDNLHMKLPPPEREWLAELEQPGVPTIHNMIMGDRVLRTLDYTESLAYATFLAKRLECLYRQIAPSIIIGSFDGVQGSIAMAVARKLGIPWFALNFTTIPTGLSGFCTGMTPDTSFIVRPADTTALRALAEKVLCEFETRKTVVPAYSSANSLGMIIKRLPKHIQAFHKSVITFRSDKFTQYSAQRLVRQYLRKRRNLLFLPKQWFIDTPPDTPYLFIGLHMQPESSIDVWAPFYSNQFSVIEAIARSTPPTHQVLVKLHKSDADNYSRQQLVQLRRLPGVQLVSPFALSRTFIEKASLVLAIQGNIALEAALLGQPVLVFGDTKFMELPSVTKVNRITDLPEQIRGKLSEVKPTREEIIRGFMSYLSYYSSGCYNDWEVIPTETEIKSLASQFEALRDFVEGRE